MAQKIEIIRGTSNSIQIDVSDADGRPYNLGTGEKIVFGIKQKEDDADLIIVKSVSEGTAGAYAFELTPADTADLDCGRYYYDVALQSGNHFYNIIESNHFIIQPNITSWGCAE